MDEGVWNGYTCLFSALRVCSEPVFESDTSSQKIVALTQVTKIKTMGVFKVIKLLSQSINGVCYYVGYCTELVMVDGS